MKLVIQNTSHVWGGNEKWLGTLATGLVSRGHDVVVSCAMGPVHQELSTRGIVTTPFRPRGPIDFVSGTAFAAWLVSQRADTLLLTSWRATTWATLAAGIAKVPRVAMRLGIVRRFPVGRIKALALRHVDALIVNSAEIRDEWIASGAPHKPNSVHVILNGVRSRIDERASLRNALRTELGVAADTLIVGAAGHIAPRKGFDTLLRAFAKAAVGNACLAIIGDGPSRTGLELLANDLGIGSRTLWLGHRPDGAAAIGGLDLFVLSSQNEGMANVMLEAMAGGTPVIAFDISGVRKALGQGGESGAAGWIVGAGDVQALGHAIELVCRQIRDGSPEVASRVREAHSRVEAWFSPERMVDECERVLFPR